MKGYRRNESSAREGIDTKILNTQSVGLVAVEMSHQPERALTQKTWKKIPMDVKKVEMSHQPERALTQSHPFPCYIPVWYTVEMSHQPERALTLLGTLRLHNPLGSV